MKKKIIFLCFIFIISFISYVLANKATGYIVIDNIEPRVDSLSISGESEKVLTVRVIDDNGADNIESVMIKIESLDENIIQDYIEIFPKKSTEFGNTYEHVFLEGNYDSYRVYVKVSDVESEIVEVKEVKSGSFNLITGNFFAFNPFKELFKWLTGNWYQY